MKLTQAEAELVIFHAAKTRGDLEAEQRKAAVAATIAKRAAGEAVTGFPTVGKLLGSHGAWAIPHLQKLLGTVASPVAASVLDLVDATDVKLKKPEWAIPDWLPLGELALLGGNPGDFKSTIADTFAAHITTGAPLWGGIAPVMGNVIIANAEDPLHIQKARLMAAGCDLTKVKFLQGANAGGAHDLFTIQDHLPALANAIKETGAKYVSLDPLLSFLGPKTNSYSDHHVKLALTPLLKLAMELKVAIVGVWHFNKTTGKIALHSDLPPSEWSIDYFSLDHEGEEKWARGTSRRRLSASCVRQRSYWRRAGRRGMRVVGSPSPSKHTIAGARNMAV